MKYKIYFAFIIVLIAVVGYRAFNIEPQKSNEKEEISLKVKIVDIDSFYNQSLTKQYDIRKINEDPDVNQLNGELFNYGKTDAYINMVNAFIEKMNKNEDAYIRILMYTVEGDLCIRDLYYEASTKIIHEIYDNTRDTFSSNRQIDYIAHTDISLIKKELQESNESNLK